MNCEQEARLIEALAAAGGEPLPADWPPHLEACAACRETHLVWRALREAASHPPGGSQAGPAPGLIWWRAQLAARREAVARSEQPVRAMHWAAAVAMVAAGPLAAGGWFGGKAALEVAAVAALVIAIPAGGLLYFWKRG